MSATAYISTPLVRGLILLALVCPALVSAQDGPGAPTKKDSRMQPSVYYQPDGEAIVRKNGLRYHNRPLYFHQMPGFVLGGDRPHLRFSREPYALGDFMVALVRGERGKWLHEFAENTARYLPGRMEWRLSDPELPGVEIELAVAPLADASGFAVRLRTEGIKPGDRLVWAFGGGWRPASSPDGSGSAASALDPVGGTASPQERGNQHLLTESFTPAKCAGNLVDLRGGVFVVAPTETREKAPLCIAAGRCSAPTTLSVADATDWADPAKLSASAGADLPLVCGVTPLERKGQDLFWVIKSFDPAAALDDFAAQPLEPLFDEGWKKAETIARRVVVDTPDPRLNAAVGAVGAAMAGLIRPPVILHGGMSWNFPYMGWRTMYGPTAFGWHNEVRTTAAHYLASQNLDDTLRQPHAEKSHGLSEEARDSRFYGRGRLNHPENHMYDMQSLLFDMVAHAWRWTGDAELEKLLGKTIGPHLDWMRECFDPDGDGLYESYLNVAEADNVWYSGGGSVEETAYAYSAQRTAAELARRSGDVAGAARHSEEAEAIRQAFLRLLWIEPKGHPGAYREQGGHRRLHEDAWLYSIFLPIDVGLLTPEQAVQALDYTEWGLERVPMPGGGERIWTSNWVPTGWSNRMLWPAHCYSLALAYAQAGLPAQAWNMLQGGFAEACFNEVTPGGFASGTTGTDFHDDVCSFGRAVVEGLFGYCPDYPNGRVRCAPQFPPNWDRASIATADFTLSFKRKHGTDRYELSLTQAAALELRVPVRARKITGVELDGRSANYRVEPGFGQTILVVEKPVGKQAKLVVHWSEPLPQEADGAVHLEVNAGEPLHYAAPEGLVTGWRDPQGVFENAKTTDGALDAVIARNAGHHLAFVQVQCGELPQWRLLKLKIDDPQAVAAAAALEPGPFTPAAQWECLDLQPILNGDVRTIFKQSYVSPRPATCSLRIGDNGYHSWPFYYWQSNPAAPEIDLKAVDGLLDTDGRLRTPQGAPFRWSGEDRNIAFTSLWDNWPKSVTLPVGKTGSAAWFLVCGSTNVMQTRIANAVLRLRYTDGQEDRLELVPPLNYWALCPVAGGFEYDHKRDAFCLPSTPPATVQLGANCRAMLLGRALRPGVVLNDVTLETLSPEVVVGLMGVTLMK